MRTLLAAMAVVCPFLGSIAHAQVVTESGGVLVALSWIATERRRFQKSALVRA